MRNLAVAIVLLLASREAATSDKGLKSEIVEGCYKIFCETDIAKDLRPIVETQQAIAIQKMSQESLAEQLRMMNEQWAMVKTKYKDAIASSELTPRLANVKRPYRKLSTDEAWTMFLKKCPAKKQSPGSAAYMLELLDRLYPYSE